MVARERPHATFKLDVPRRGSWYFSHDLDRNRCEENHVKKLKATLRTLSSTMSISQSMMRVINGKVVYLFKITDQMNSKLDILSQDLKIVQNTFTSWQRQLKKFANSVRCHEGLTMEFLSKYTAEINRAFVAFLRLFEIQDTLSQISHLNEKPLVGYSDLPKFISSHLSAKLSIDPSLRLTITALEEGLSVLAGPMVDVEHDGQNLTIDILLLAPEITDKNSFCVVEHLTPLKFNISGKCFSGPVQHTNLALINCPNSRQVVSLEGLDRCFSSEVGFLCPKNVLKSVSSLQWLGFAWNPNLKLSFPRNHEVAPDCDHIHPLIHLGGRYFLSTTSGTLTLSSGELDVSPLAVYNFPCNVSFIGMKTSLGTCLQRLLVSLPLFSTDMITYVQWDPNSDDLTPLDLHQESLTIPPPIKINRTVIDNFNELFQRYDGQLSDTLQKADSLIDQIEETTISSYVEYIAFIALGLSGSILSSVVLFTDASSGYLDVEPHIRFLLPCQHPFLTTSSSRYAAIVPNPKRTIVVKKLHVNSVATRNDLEQRSRARLFGTRYSKLKEKGAELYLVLAFLIYR